MQTTITKFPEQVKNHLAHAIYVLLLALMPPAHAADGWQDMSAVENSMWYSDERIRIRGAWAASQEYKAPRIGRGNVATIECDHAGMRCKEMQANFSQSRSGASASGSSNISSAEYQVVEWTRDLVVAKRLGPDGKLIDVKLEITHASRLVSLEWKDEAQGAGGFDPQQQKFEMAIEHLYRKRDPGK